MWILSQHAKPRSKAHRGSLGRWANPPLRAGGRQEQRKPSTAHGRRQFGLRRGTIFLRLLYVKTWGHGVGGIWSLVHPRPHSVTKNTKLLPPGPPELSRRVRFLWEGPGGERAAIANMVHEALPHSRLVLVTPLLELDPAEGQVTPSFPRSEPEARLAWSDSRVFFFFFVTQHFFCVMKVEIIIRQRRRPAHHPPTRGPATMPDSVSAMGSPGKINGSLPPPSSSPPEVVPGPPKENEEGSRKRKAPPSPPSSPAVVIAPTKDPCDHGAPPRGIFFGPSPSGPASHTRARVCTCCFRSASTARQHQHRRQQWGW